MRSQMAVALSVLVLLGAGCGTTGAERSEDVVVATSSTTAATTTTTLRPTTTTARVTTTLRRTTTTISEQSRREQFWRSLLDVVQGGDEGMVGYWNRATEAANSRRYVDMGVECALASNLVEGWYWSVDPAPDSVTQNLVDTFFDELNSFFYWCSGGTGSSADLASPHFDVARELLARLDAAAEADGLTGGLLPND